MWMSWPEIFPSRMANTAAARPAIPAPTIWICLLLFVMGPPRQNYRPETPVILVGHNAGAHTCPKLRQLLAEDYWGVGSNVDCIEAAICIAGVLNGSALISPAAHAKH